MTRLMAGGEPLPLALGPAVHGYESPIAESEDACGAAFERLIDDSGVAVLSDCLDLDVFRLGDPELSE